MGREAILVQVKVINMARPCPLCFPTHSMLIITISVQNNIHGVADSSKTFRALQQVDSFSCVGDVNWVCDGSKHYSILP